MSIMIWRLDIRYGDNFDQSQGLQLRFDNREVQNNDILVAAMDGGRKADPINPHATAAAAAAGAEMQKLAEKSSRANV